MLELSRRVSIFEWVSRSNRPAVGVCEESLNKLKPLNYKNNILKTDSLPDTVLNSSPVVSIFVLS